MEIEAGTLPGASAAADEAPHPKDEDLSFGTPDRGHPACQISG